MGHGVCVSLCDLMKLGQYVKPEHQEVSGLVHQREVVQQESFSVIGFPKSR